jgi:radical SAM protein with 4Fe4S-binding SPASM domain
MILGNINQQDIKDILSPESEVMNRLIEERLASINSCKSRKCKFFYICNGGCPYYSFIKSDGNNLKEIDYLCNGKTLIYKYLKSIVVKLNEQQEMKKYE